ncbi:hypothetical protein [Acidovorax facilis]|uniref:hypothetical protein n=1 Tax=Acidovorax facilis TaxID=12917 RepID=UPI003D655B02
MRTEIARPSDAVAIAAVLREAAQWLVDQKIPLWLVSDFTDDSVQRDVDGGLYVVAKASEAVVGGCGALPARRPSLLAGR